MKEVKIYLLPEEIDTLDAMAAEKGLTRSALIRNILFNTDTNVTHTDFKKIRAALNSIDRLQKISLHLLSSIIGNAGYRYYYPATDDAPDIVQQAKSMVDKMIAAQNIASNYDKNKGRSKT